ncbi:adenylate/guanylate cyclase domain-containing protein [Sulfitobacter mediterraneus]|uniref:TolB-like protein n=1 Tax=Sulfitobacter mediterraneus TaxID=83219 RepID=A0A2T6BX84_9RHOB|nr:adenylate/guanylate cyclase domain-containing protein [Sulfitobacter mediterraneus]KIN75164.1 Tetratricopeptide TPR 2 repeat protein [Sulfitobacter mediterraneus KCTC 32188]PTX60685.1 TolB-like protein [Sulfitobacter mediterraneus]
MDRRLAAILAADVVGYSKLMGSDESGTLSSLRSLRKDLLSPLVEQNNGAILKSMGDGWFIEFQSITDAASCALALQDAVEGGSTIQLRIGLHIGEVTIADEDIYGDGMNISARLQEMAAAGAIVISDAARRAMDGRLASEFQNLGAQDLKNIDEPMIAFGRGMEAAPTAAKNDRKDETSKPSIAIRPFKLLSRDKEQEFLADGIVEDLITALARFQWLSVIGRNSTFAFKGSAASSADLAAEIGVRYFVEGSVRASPSRVRVNVQLIDAKEDKNIWAETYDRPQGELFDLQDEVTRSITGVLVPALSKAEMDRSMRSNHPTLGAWQSYQKGLAFYYRPFSVEDHAEAKRHFDLAIRRDPNFSDAYAMVALMGAYSNRSGQTSYGGSPEEIIAEALQAAEKAVLLDDGGALAHIALGVVNSWMGEFDTAVAECQTAVRLNSNLALAHHELGFALNLAGRCVEATDSFDAAIRLSPNDPGRWNFYLLKGSMLFAIGNFDAAVECLNQSARLRPASFFPHVFLAATYIELNDDVAAQESVSQILKRKADLKIENLRMVFGKAPAEHLLRAMKNLEIAGLPA